VKELMAIIGIVAKPGSALICRVAHSRVEHGLTSQAC
jgi:hypothetical protein